MPINGSVNIASNNEPGLYPWRLRILHRCSKVPIRNFLKNHQFRFEFECRLEFGGLSCYVPFESFPIVFIVNVGISTLKQRIGLIKLFVYYFKSLSFDFSPQLLIPKVELYDIGLNRGYITVGDSHDTSEFACDCIYKWWQEHGQVNYPNATSMLFLCDCGGSNNARHYIFKEKLQELANKIGIEIRIAHYPPYTSKYNPIEHRLFPHVTRACKGVIFKSLEIVKEHIGKAATKPD